MDTKINGLWYLASPFSHAEAGVRAWRVEQNFLTMGKLLNAGYRVFSPLVHTYQLESRIAPELAHKHSFWMDQDIALLRHCDGMFILTLDGWVQSKGVNQELKVARSIMIPIVYLSAAGEILETQT